MSVNFDESVIMELKALEAGSGQNFVKQIIDQFIESLQPEVEKLESFSESGNLRAVSEMAHSLKSSCANVGAKKMSELAEIIETKISYENCSDPNEVIPLIKEMHDRVPYVLERLKKMAL